MRASTKFESTEVEVPELHALEPDHTILSTNVDLQPDSFILGMLWMTPL